MKTLMKWALLICVFFLPNTASALSLEEAKTQTLFLQKVSAYLTSLATVPPVSDETKTSINKVNTDLDQLHSRLTQANDFNFENNLNKINEQTGKALEEFTNQLIQFNDEFNENDQIENKHHKAIDRLLEGLGAIGSRYISSNDQYDQLKKKKDHLKGFIDALKNEENKNRAKSILDGPNVKDVVEALEAAFTTLKDNPWAFEDYEPDLSNRLSTVEEQLSKLRESVANYALEDINPEVFEKFKKLESDKFEKGKREFFDAPWWGVGITITFDVGNNDRIEDATIDANGIVRVNKDQNVIPRFMLETHYFFKLNEALNKMNEFKPLRWINECLFNLDNGKFNIGHGTGIGPFVAVVPGGDDVIDAVGGGIMLGWRREENSTESFNLGFGVAWDPNVKVLGGGFVPNQPAPAGVNNVALKETDQVGLLVVASFSF